MSNNTCDFFNADLYVNNNGRPSLYYGQWSDKRRMAFVENMIEYHPFSKKVVADANNTDQSLNKLARSSLKDNLKTFIKDIRDKMTKDFLETGTNDSETTFENSMLTLKTMYGATRRLDGKKKSKKVQKELIEKRDRNARLIEGSKRRTVISGILKS
ncbi:hypothetical protein BD770DRAFT_428193 [Pilaira anomala]|nr:hypothetical protein BD770DRAFT_428193 [Pilaira anomala]